ncbi:hypothetical protein DFJ77DRAFT_239911 [Powellomyces hirtus]|nr:hypothetical protein DFJ77DRAFT_239911 [Powellomyces hirtus]
MRDHERAVCSRGVAAILQHAGFASATVHALDLLEQTYSTYIHDLCTRIHRYAELAARTRPNSEDVLLGLLDIGTAPTELAGYMELVAASPPPHVPQQAQQGTERPPRGVDFEPDAFRYADDSRAKADAFGARHFPPFPNPHTYVASKLPAPTTDDATSIPVSSGRTATVPPHIRRARQARQVEDNLTAFLTRSSRIAFQSQPQPPPSSSSSTTSSSTRPSSSSQLSTSTSSPPQTTTTTTVADDEDEDLLLPPVNYELAWRRPRRAAGGAGAAGAGGTGGG